MDCLLQVDVGHLCNAAGEVDLLSEKDCESLGQTYGAVFRSFQQTSQNAQSPLALSLQGNTIIPQIKALAQQLKASYDTILLLGIGGSALGARAAHQFINGPFYHLEQKQKPRFFVLDNLDPLLVAKLEQVLDMKKTALIYTSKSGSTPETAAQFVYFYRKYMEAGGNQKDITIICDPGDNGINAIARELGCHLLHIPKDLPGRYSVLSAVGFLPGELVGIDSQEMLTGAQTIQQAILEQPLEKNALFLLGTCLYQLSQKGKTMHVLFNYSNFLYEFGLWFVQLWAESLGKKTTLDGTIAYAGTTPLTSLGATDQHSILQLFKEGPRDKVIGFVTMHEFPADPILPGEFPNKKEYAYFAGKTMAKQLHIEQMATEMTLVGAGVPCYRLVLKDFSAKTLGALFYFYEALVVYTAALWHINPYNQPGVEEGKHMTYALMGREDYLEKQSAYEEAVKQFDTQRKILGL